MLERSATGSMATARSSELIKTRGISKSFGGVAALSDGSLDGRRGEVHALLGENGAGKSTFIQILSGATRPDAGVIELEGTAVRFRNPRQARVAGVAAVFQELSLIPDLTVEENIWFQHEPLSRLRVVSSKALRTATLELFQHYGFPELSVGRQVQTLSLSEQQLVEIAKALSLDPSILILDEATSAFAHPETQWLLWLSRKLAADGRLVIYITHRLDEVRRIADRVTIFRNGRTVSTYCTEEMDNDTIIADMLGRSIDRLYPEHLPSSPAGHALKIRRLTVGSRLTDVDLDLYSGEILGVAGLQGHGQRELFDALFGICEAHGKVELWGQQVKLSTPRKALKLRDGIALVPEDRRMHGLLLGKSVRENLTLSAIGCFSRFGLTNAKREAELVRQIIDSLRIKAVPEQTVGSLSGGNQQKVILGKMLLTEARVLLLYDPTRGIDVGTKAEIFHLLQDLSRKSYAILFYSTDLAELVHMASRIAVFRNGQVARIVSGAGSTEHDILRVMVGEN